MGDPCPTCGRAPCVVSADAALLQEKARADVAEDERNAATKRAVEAEASVELAEQHLRAMESTHADAEARAANYRRERDEARRDAKHEKALADHMRRGQSCCTRCEDRGETIRRLVAERHEAGASLLKLNTESERRLREALVAERQRDTIAAAARAFIATQPRCMRCPEIAVRGTRSGSWLLCAQHEAPAGCEIHDLEVRALVAALDAIEGK